MERVGVKKEIDKLGRICIPKEMRNLFNFENEVELYITQEGILLKNPEYVLVKKEDYNKCSCPYMKEVDKIIRGTGL